ncbi:putative endopeptidase precursor [Micromonospora sp. MW-13]|uniref:C40 family peptidase n=1 Tax=Micromonospora sp. MW-13 TaxID=2094022 RepID=UPI000EC367E9|nr:C40 family peptidase [Micromonospora sp. MW-13]RGC65003.1 putative endopeptidase precursor [Micromonospora sp. MW-13]
MSTADQVIAYGMAEIGKPYVWGNEGPNSFDCSGLMQWIFGKVGIDLPRTAREQQRWAKPVTDPRPGDLVFWGNPATHVGLYLGGGRFLAAPSAGRNVQVSKLYGRPTYGRAPGLSGVAGAVGDLVTTLPVAAGGGTSAVDRSADLLLIGLVAAGGVALVAMGGWQAVKGGQS